MDIPTIDMNTGQDEKTKKDKSAKSNKSRSNKSKSIKSDSDKSRHKEKTRNKTREKSASSVNIRKQNSVEISISELEGIANAQKLKDTFNVKRDDASSRSKSGKDEHSNSSSEESHDDKKTRRYDKKVRHENKSTETKKKKMDLLFKISQLTNSGRKSSVSMEYTLEDIELEYRKLQDRLQKTQGIDMGKTLLMLAVQGMEYGTTTYASNYIDLQGWSESMSYQMQTDNYDKVIGELYEKYKDSVDMIPELKLMVMLGGSAAMFAFSKRMVKQDPTEMFAKMFETPPKNPQQPRQGTPRQQSQGGPPLGGYAGNSGQYNNYVNQRQEREEEVSIYSSNNSDNSESKLNDPDEDETCGINDILKKMNENKKGRRGRPVGSKNKKKEIVLN